MRNSNRCIPVDANAGLPNGSSINASVIMLVLPKIFVSEVSRSTGSAKAAEGAISMKRLPGAVATATVAGPYAS